MKIIHLTTILLGAILFSQVSLSVNADTVAPLKQIKSGIPIHEIQCKEEQILVQKIDNTPACINPESIAKLMNRGWVQSKTIDFDNYNHNISYSGIGSTIKEISIFGQEPKPCTGIGCLTQNTSSFVIGQIDASNSGNIVMSLNKSIMYFNESADNGFVVMINAEESEFTNISNSTHTILITEIISGSSEIEIVGHSENYKKFPQLK